MSKLKISPIFAVDNNKGECISSDQMVKYEGEACTNGQAINEKTNQGVRY